ncbi:BON domain-containing protein [Wenzhouxiangella sp. AB-CW3]|uniref:BON domain-containing protein n=1 Tax=Wenzhouxiangella sp. AB-CW3 TaxID=2771012 RepID=UPI00168B251C|nr:BON domain-containing protein [Wenzhouxiangella sp. AB-CW3]QOC23418.1 BON domain-containing protein [Wenzhouxiangella sp. AB-CW3]
MNKLIRCVIALLVLSMLSACAALVVGGAAATGMAVHDRRSFGTVVDDRVLRIRVSDALHRHEAMAGESTRLRILAYNGWVLLAGEVPDQQAVDLATEVTEDVDGVRRVINELAVTERAGMGQSSTDRWISSKVNTSLARVRDIQGFDPTRVKVISARNIVYLMGLVSNEEAEAAVEQARTVRGVERVVTAFEYLESG